MIQITTNHLNLREPMRELEDNSAGALSILMGNVRNRGRFGNVLEIYYKAYSEMAEEKMRDLVQTFILTRSPSTFTSKVFWSFVRM